MAARKPTVVAKPVPSAATSIGAAIRPQDGAQLASEHLKNAPISVLANARAAIAKTTPSNTKSSSAFVDIDANQTNIVAHLTDTPDHGPALVLTIPLKTQAMLADGTAAAIGDKVTIGANSIGRFAQPMRIDGVVVSEVTGIVRINMTNTLRAALVAEFAKHASK